MARSTVTQPASGRQRVNRNSLEVRDRLIEAALVEFAAKGFDGASTRAIATRAGTHQPQINYHFTSKEELWRAALERLLAELDEAIEARAEGVDRADEREMLAAVVRGLVHFAARRPELNRIMMHEGTSPGPRLSWLVENHLGWRHRDLRRRWEALSAEGRTGPLPADILYHVVIGAASLLYANAPEARLLGVDPSDPAVVDAHAESLIALLLPNG